MEEFERIQEADWVVAPRELAAPVITRRFYVGAAGRAELQISALGFMIPYVNGRRVGDEYFRPSNSLFCRRETETFLYPIFDELTYRCYYSTFDISDCLQSGENVLEIALGNGWYRQERRTAEGNVAFGDSLGARFAIKITDENGERTLLSDGSEICRASQIISSDLFFGETVDYRLREFAQSPVQLRSLPETLLMPEEAPPDRVMRVLLPRVLLRKGNCAIYDAGENVSGFAVLQIDAAYGERVAVRYAETFDGEDLNFQSTGAEYRDADGEPQIMQDVVIGDGKMHLFAPKFVWHAFRYFEVEGNAEPLEVRVIHSDVPVTAGFHSSSPGLNWLFSAFLRTQTDNMHGGVPSDCPHRERLGYTGDGQVCAPAAMLFLDGRRFYKKWIRDIFDSQDKLGGHVNHTAPFAGGGGGPGGWGMAAITVPYAYYKIYGDLSPAREHFDGIKKWVGYLKRHSENGLIVCEEAGGWCLGDWCTPEKTEIPESYVNTCLFIRALRMAEILAAHLGKAADAEEFEVLRRAAAKAVKKRYYDTETGSFAGGIQGADAFAVAAGVAENRTVSALMAKYSALRRFDTGFLGTDLLTEALFENGGENIAFAMLTSHELGGFGYLQALGLTTIAEAWRADGSLNHPMFGACCRMLFGGLLGITQAEDSFGFRDLVIRPKIPSDLTAAEGWIDLTDGRVHVKWEREQNEVCFQIILPEGRTADFIYGNISRRLVGTENVFRVPFMENM